MARPIGPGAIACGDGAQEVSAHSGNAPSRGMLHRTVYHSCIICHGSRRAFDGDCQSCADPDPALARKILERLRPSQMAFLRAYGHTLAEQPVTGEEWDAHLVDFYVEDDDGAWDYDELLIPPTRHWFASGHCRMGPCGFATFIRYNPMGLLLRECLTAGADAHVAPCDSDRSAEGGETGTGSTAGESAGLQGIAQPHPTPSPPGHIKPDGANRGADANATGTGRHDGAPVTP